MGMILNPYRFAPVGPALPSAIMALSPLGYWKLNDTTPGSTAVDSSGNGRNGSYGGTAGSSYVFRDITGPDGDQYVKFNGGGVAIADNNVWSASTAPGISIFCLARPTNTTSRRFLVTKGNTSNYEWSLEIENSGQCHWAILTSAGGYRSWYTTSNGVIMNSAWNAVFARAPGITQDADLDIYVNSTSETSSSAVGGSSSASAGNGTASVVIADIQSGLANEFLGHMAHVAIFAGEIDPTTLMTAADADGWF
jgi:hypothetical protein